jgi:hypothetical protein
MKSFMRLLMARQLCARQCPPGLHLPWSNATSLKPNAQVRFSPGTRIIKLSCVRPVTEGAFVSNPRSLANRYAPCKAWHGCCVRGLVRPRNPHAVSGLVSLHRSPIGRWQPRLNKTTRVAATDSGRPGTAAIEAHSTRRPALGLQFVRAP